MPSPKLPRHDLPLLLSIVTLGLLGILYVIDPAYQQEHYATAAGEGSNGRMVELADGSRITLDPATQIDVSLHLRSRRLTLREGGAVLAVAAGGYAPFDIGAGATTIRVGGAPVAVRVTRDRLDVALEPGQAEVKGTGGSN